ncbi:transcription factor subunit Med10 of mediator complex-domain-containing protein [Polychytrium aggregatum]|uniref:transcription factor subunit Med10 of mediator complex-domain-containing protein n=1 Tax=Polychytrium aggregatum TaxID=110093 RepID=UPI0022FE0F57|nr:transcription factor subunit Med10 of mediator complex-domain-containing protein [Polychytrium aggregatum]KAI9206284.1 transcription factor subunit Med10 of mediator complex-domain-containing protein [Polychytrium aggregatum]
MDSIESNGFSAMETLSPNTSSTMQTSTPLSTTPPSSARFAASEPNHAFGNSAGSVSLAAASLYPAGSAPPADPTSILGSLASLDSVSSSNATFANGSVPHPGPPGSSPSSSVSSPEASHPPAPTPGLHSFQPPTERGDPVDSLETTLLGFLDSLLKLGITVSDFQVDSNPVLISRLNEVVSNLGELNSLKDSIDMQIPIALLECIEDGNNPDLYSRNIVQDVVSKNQRTHGKVQMLETFHSALETEIQHNFPELFTDYQAARSQPQSQPIQPPPSSLHTFSPPASSSSSLQPQMAPLPSSSVAPPPPSLQ